MCGRYTQDAVQQLLAEWFGLELGRIPFFAPSWNIAPQSTQPVIHLRGAERRISLMRWGLVPNWAKDQRIGLSTINARAEEAASKPAFRQSLERRRCLVPATAFYEWEKTGAKTRNPFAFSLRDSTPMAFAGLWDLWQPPQGDPLASYTILTTTANELMSPIHDRMPVILQPADYERWLDVDSTNKIPEDLLRPFDPEAMTSWPVDPRVGSVKNNDARLLDRFEPAQRGLFDLL